MEADEQRNQNLRYFHQALVEEEDVKKWSEFSQVAVEFMDLVVNPPPRALLLHLFWESQHFIGAFIRTRGEHFYRRSATDKRALESCVTLLYSQMVYEMCVCVRVYP